MSSSSTLQQLLTTLVESAQGGWTYIIFWEKYLATASYPKPWLGWGDGYFCHNGQYDEKKRKTSSSSLESFAEQEYRKSILRHLNNTLLPEEKRLPENSSSFEQEVTDAEWFFIISMTRYFATDGDVLPCIAWRNSVPIWVTGTDTLRSRNCVRAGDALHYGLQTLVFIPSVNGVVELGSTDLISQSLDLFNKAVPLLNFLDSREKGQPVQSKKQAESSNSVGNKAIVGSNSFISRMNWGLNLGLKSFPFKHPEDESKSSSSVGNFPVPLVKENSTFSGKLYWSNDENSDSSDLKAFVRILKRRRG